MLFCFVFFFPPISCSQRHALTLTPLSPTTSVHPQLEEFRKAKERRAAMMAAVVANAAKDAQFLDDSASSTLGGGGMREGASIAIPVARAKGVNVRPSSNKHRRHDDTVADLESLRAFGMITPPRENIGAGAGAAAAAAARARALGSSPSDVDDLLDDLLAGKQQRRILPTTPPEQDPLVEMLTRQVRSLQREKAEMGEENAALRREVRSLEDLVESLENLLESGCVEEEEEEAGLSGRGGDRVRVLAQATEEGGGEAKPSQMAAAAAAAADRFLAASEEVPVQVQVPIVSSSVRRHDRIVSSGRNKNSYVGEWLDDTVALRLEDIERSIGDAAAAAAAAAGDGKWEGFVGARRQPSPGAEAWTSDPPSGRRVTRRWINADASAAAGGKGVFETVAGV